MQKLTPATFKQLQDEAEGGSMQAQYALGAAYLNGNGVKRNPEAGTKWLRKAAESGHIAAQCDLGVMYQKGIGVECDYQETLKWYRLAADQGDALAQHNLGSVHAKGFKVKGLGFFNPTAFAFARATQDFVVAYKWFSLAAANGHAASMKDRAIIKLRMTAAQISKAEGLIKEFQEAHSS
ncbi:MAG: tetratricopeptide repeat protein [Alphaproteobacteria bacterium]|nr:tetratricopeptide repeat protein [Alphaproteobacteria bacterium]